MVKERKLTPRPAMTCLCFERVMCVLFALLAVTLQSTVSVSAAFPCEPLNEVNCTHFPGCAWVPDAKLCVPRPPCAQLVGDSQCASLPTACRFVNGSCVPLDCSAFRASASACARVGCTWADAASMCINADCALATTWLTAHPAALNISCRWLTNNSCAGVFTDPASSHEACIDKAYVNQPCSNVSTKRDCNLQQPSNRCAVNVSSALDAAPSVCLPFRMPCANYTSASMCPAYCSWLASGSVCIDLACGRYSMDKTNCTDRGCLWTPLKENNGTCADRNAALLPCPSFGSNTCPPLRCVLNAATNMCSAIGGSSSAVAQACSDFLDAQSCLGSSNLTCWFNMSLRACVDAPCHMAPTLSSAAGFFCPLPRCRNVSWSCVDACPAQFTLCSETGRCAPSSNLCTTCPASQVQCWDSSCVTAVTDCKCPPYLPYRCEAGGACVANRSKCDAVCDAKLVLCPDMTCAPTLKQCPCPAATPLMCAAKNNTCAVDEATCNATCPLAAPVACSSGSCSADQASCACDWMTPVRCPTNGRCYTTLAQCPCPGNVTRCTSPPYFCANTCDDVPKLCPSNASTRCSNGACATSLRNCPCQDTAVIPQVTIMSATATFDAGKWLRLAAFVNYSVCGIDRSAEVDVAWIVSGGGRPNNTAGLQLSGTTLALPPNYVTTIGGVVTIVAKGVVWSKSAAGATVAQTVVATIRVTPYAPLPVLEFLGGAQRFAGTTDRLALNVAVTDPFRGHRDGVNANMSWGCCRGVNCGDMCPPNVTAFLSSITTASLVFPFALEAGKYNFTFWYLGSSVVQTVIVLNGTVPDIRLYTRSSVFVVSEPTYIYALLPPNAAAATSMTAEWMINGSAAIATALRSNDAADGAVFVIRGNGALAEGATHNITLAVTLTWALPSGQRQTTFGASSIIITTSVTPQLRCGVTITDGSINATALSSSIRVTASSSSLSSSVQFRFGFVDFLDSSMTKVRDAPLTSAYQDFPQLDTVAPMTLGIGLLRRSMPVVFYVVARLGGAVDAARAICNITISPSSANTTTLLQERRQSLDLASLNGDVSSIVSTTSSVATLAASSDNTTAQQETFASVVSVLASIVKGGNSTALSSEQRGSLVQTIGSFVTTVGGGNISADDRGKLLDVLTATITTTASNAAGSSDTAFDPNRDGPTVMAMLNRLKLDVNVTRAAERLGSSLAQNAPLGVVTALTSQNISVVAVNSLAGAFNGSSLATNQSGIQIPVNFSIFSTASETSMISLRAAEYRVNPLGVRGLQRSQVVSSVVDYAIDQDGVLANVTGLSDDQMILLNISIDVNTTAGNASNITCAYFDFSTDAWSTHGVTTLWVDLTSKTVVCGTLHLSTFAVSSSDASTEAPTPSPTTVAPQNTNAPATNATVGGDGDDGLGGGAIAGIVIGVLVVVGIVAAVVVTKVRGGGGTGQSKSLGSEGFDQGPQLELPPHHHDDTAHHHHHRDGGAVNQQDVTHHYADL